jgi:hypothetical protein
MSTDTKTSNDLSRVSVAIPQTQFEPLDPRRRSIGYKTTTQSPFAVAEDNNIDAPASDADLNTTGDAPPRIARQIGARGVLELAAILGHATAVANKQALFRVCGVVAHNCGGSVAYVRRPICDIKIVAGASPTLLASSTKGKLILSTEVATFAQAAWAETITILGDGSAGPGARVIHRAISGTLGLPRPVLQIDANGFLWLEVRGNNVTDDFSAASADAFLLFCRGT